MSNYIYLMSDKHYDIPIDHYVKPSELKREWFASYFYHCLPLVAANSMGWTVHNLYEFSVIWDGTNTVDGLKIESQHPEWAVSWFGHGIFTISPGFVVQTSPGTNLLVKGLPNWFKREVISMEGLIETDWLKSSFTLNFKIMEPNIEIRIPKGEPLTQLLPYPRQYIEGFDASIKNSGPVYEQFFEEFVKWIEKRDRDIKMFGGSKRDFSYLKGMDFEGEKFPDHQKIVKTPELKTEKNE